MIYSRDQWVQLPTKDLYDTNVMMAAVSAAKDMYDKRQKTMEDFYEKYGTFDSPFAKDMERYGNLIQNVTDAVDDMYAQGVDPLRSAEGGAQLSRLIHAFPIAELNRMKANAKIGYSYLDALGKLQSAGKYSKEQEDYMLNKLGLPSFSNFSTSEYGSWDRTSPMEAQNLFDLVNPMVKDMKSTILSAADVKDLGGIYRKGYDYTGITRNMLSNAIGNQLPGLRGTFGYDFFRDSAKRQLQAAGNSNPTDEEIDKKLLENATQSVAYKAGIEEEKVNPLYLENVKHAHELARSRPTQPPLPKNVKESNFAITSFANLVAGAFGKKYGYADYPDLAINYGQDDLIEKQRSLFGLNVKGKNKSIGSAKSNREAINALTVRNIADPGQISVYIGGNGILNAESAQHLMSTKAIAKNVRAATSINGKPVKNQTWQNTTDTSKLNSILSNSDFDATIQPTGNGVCVVGKDNRTHMLFEVKIAGQDGGRPYHDVYYYDSGVVSGEGNLMIDPTQSNFYIYRNRQADRSVNLSSQIKEDPSIYPQNILTQ